MNESPRREPILSDFATDPEMKELLSMFVSELPDRLSAIRDAWDQSDLDSIRRIAHQLKGASGGYGFGAIGTAAARLEASLAAQATDLTHAQNELTALIELCQRAKA